MKIKTIEFNKNDIFVIESLAPHKSFRNSEEYYKQMIRGFHRSLIKGKKQILLLPDPENWKFTIIKKT